ncbi:MAG: thioesterase family protein [Candidatus Ranarchaeia archaeon]
MNLIIKENLVKEETYLVEDNHIAKFLGTGDVSVLSTPSMIRFMEQTCLIAVDSEIDKEYTTVGTKVCIYHLAAAPKGSKIKINIKLVLQEKRKLTFEVTAYWKNTKIGEGKHERFIINKKKFLINLEQKMREAK